MSDLTPDSADKELRDLIQQALITVEYDYREAHAEILKNLQALILNREAAARIYELERMVKVFDPNKHFWLQVNDRLAALQASTSSGEVDGG